MAIRLAVAGCAGHGLLTHIFPGMSLGFKVVAVFDPSSDNIEAMRDATGFNPTVFTTFEEMVASPNVDAVLITSPDKFHPDQLLAAVKAGKPVLCDKPWASDQAGLQKVRHALDIAEARDIAVLSCHPRREISPMPYGWVKANFEMLTKRFGDLVHVELDFSYHAPSEEWKLNRSLLLDHFTHEIDFLLWLVGNVRFEAYRLVDSHDRYTVAGKIADDVTFLFNGTRRLANKTYPETIHLRFDRGSCTVNTKTGEVILRDHENEELDTWAISPIDYDARSAIVMTGFAEAIASGADPEEMQHLFEVNRSAVVLAGRTGIYHSPEA